MKHLNFFLFVAIIPFFFGCNEDLPTLADEDQMISIRAPKTVTKPHKFSMSTTTDIQSPTMPAIPDIGINFFTEGWLHGHMTHLGRLNDELSTWTIENIYFFPPSESQPPIIEYHMNVEMWGMNGKDAIFGSETIWINVVEQTLTGESIVTGGVGKFEGVTGSTEYEGTVTGSPGDPEDPSVATFRGEGTLTFVK